MEPIENEFVLSELTALEVYDDELIFAPGFIQPHGILVLLQKPHLNILQVSANAQEFFGIAPETLLGKPLQSLFNSEQVERLVACLARRSLELGTPLELITPTQGVFRGIFSALKDDLLLELEPQLSPEKDNLSQPYPHLQKAIDHCKTAQNINHLTQIIAEEIKKITGFDRVMVYRFASDHSGDVIAEVKEHYLESYFRLRYPATDIPATARQLFYRNRIRFIPDVHHTPVSIIPPCHPYTGAPLDQRDSWLRGVSSNHIEYLHNMGVAGSMTISLLGEQELWGLIACHHYTPRLVDYETRKICELLGQYASIELLNWQEKELKLYRERVKSMEDNLQAILLENPEQAEKILTYSFSELLDLVNAKGIAVLLDGNLRLVGQTPTAAEVKDLVVWLEQQNLEQVFATNALSQCYAPGRQFKDKASGVLVISLRLKTDRQQFYHILWFRPEQIHSVNWAGNPRDSMTVNSLGEMELSPRKSFALWQETVQEKSLPWRAAELEAAKKMLSILMLAVLEFSRVALEQAVARAEIASLAKSQFLAKMTHELRTPLNVIMGFTQLMNRNQNLTPELQEYLGIISRSGEHLLGLINDVLDMSKIEAGHLTLTETSFDLHQMISTLTEMFSLKATSKGIVLLIELDPTLPRYVFGDESKLRQILINLLSNAVKFTSTGRITLRLRGAIEISSLLKLHIEVEDTGSGIAQEDLEHIFKAFVQTENGRHTEGTGLGLSISRQFAQLMGGEILVCSTLDRGSTFTCNLLLSIADELKVVAPAVSRIVVGLKPEQPVYRILVVEDITENRHLLVILLETVGFEVRAAVNGRQAIAIWSEWQPHLIWMDIQMPEINGYEATREIRSRPGGDAVIIIALTASAFEEDGIASQQAGCNDWVIKPFVENTIFEKIAYHLGVSYCYSNENKVKSSSPEVFQRPLTAEDLQIMPRQWIDQVHQATLVLDDGKLYNLIAQVPNPNLAHALNYLVDNFQFEVIANITQDLSENP